MDKLKYYFQTALDVQWIREEDNKLITSKLTISDYPFLITNKKAKPLMRPLSSLTKPITVEGYNDGKPFVPVIELAKLSGFEPNEPEIKIQNETVVMLNKSVHFNKMESFEFFDIDIDSDFGFQRGRITIIGETESISYYPIKNEFALFELLFRWQFWLFDQSEFGKSIIEIKE